MNLGQLSVAIVTWTLLLSWLAESLLESIIMPAVDLVLGFVGVDWAPEAKAKANGLIKTWVALLLGIGVAFAFSLNLMAIVAELLNQPVPQGWVGILMTGFIIGRGSQFVHDFFKRVQPA